MVGWLPVFHDMGLIGNVLQPLFVGFPSILLSPVAFLQEPVKWLRAITQYRATTTGAPNFAWDHCAKAVTEEQKQGLDLSSLQIAYNGAEPVRAETLDRFAAAFFRCGFRLECFFPCYGLAESTLFVSGGPPQRTPVRVRVCSPSLEAHAWASLNDNRKDTRWLVSSGQASKGTRVEIVNPETCKRCRRNEVGEIWIASASVASGYWNKHEETKDLLRASLADTGEGPFLRTGDLGYVANGELFITGRLKDLIIIRGRNLYPQDIEAAVERALPFVQPNSCAAFASLVNGEERLVIVVEADRNLARTTRAAEKEQSASSGTHPNGNSATTMLDALIGKVRQAIIEEFEVLVHSVAFLRPGEFPRTSSGKVQRRRCREGMQSSGLEIVHQWKVTEEKFAVVSGDDALAAINGHGLKPGINHDSAATERSSPRYSLENDHLRRGLKRAALIMGLSPLVGMAVLLPALWGTWVTPLGLILLAAMFFITMAGITVGFHRHFTHNAFKTTGPVRVSLAIAGSMAGQSPLIYWVATHRRHHQCSDSEGDPHSPHLNAESGCGRLKGLWYAHFGWMYHHETTNTSAYAKDLVRDPAMLRVSQLYWWLVLLGLALPAAIGGLFTWTCLGACEGLFWGGFCRIFLVHHFTWSVNSICHMYGKRDFDTNEHSVNNVWFSVPTLGESWHNNHHAFPSAAVFSQHWWQLDLGGSVVKALEAVGLAWDVKRARRDTQIEACQSTEVTPNKQRFESLETQGKQNLNLVGLGDMLHSKVLQWIQSELDTSLRTIDSDASFMTLGIDSVGAASIALEIEKVTGHHLPPEIIYEYRTIRELTRYLQARIGNTGKPATLATSAPPRRRGASFIDNLIQRDRQAASLKERGFYFFETSFSEIDGNSASIDGRRMIMLSSFSYLGLVGHPEVNQASIEAIQRFGAGAHGVRLLAGTTILHHELESALAGFMAADDAVVYGTGYVTNVATILSLVGIDGYVIGDELNHASIADGCTYAGGEFVTFKHNDLNSLENHLRVNRGRNTLVVVDAVYSMEGDIAPVPEIARLCDRYNALLMVDEAHSLGVLGRTGRGVQEHFDLPPDAIDIKMGTLSKALGSQGGFVAGSKEIISFLKHNARGFMFSTASPAPNMACALKALQILQREPDRVVRLRRNTARFLVGVRAQGFETTNTETPIIPLLCKTEERTLLMTAKCRERGLYVVPIFYPVVPMQSPRIRITLIATHTDEEIEHAIEILGQVGREVGVLCPTPRKLVEHIQQALVFSGQVSPRVAEPSAWQSPNRSPTPAATEKTSAQPATPPACEPPDVPLNGPRAAALLRRYEERNRRAVRLREQNRYFYETTIAEFDGPWVEVDGRRLLMFSSYSYLGLVGHPEVNDAVKAAIDRFGAGCHGARCIAGTTTVHRDLERELADLTNSEAALVFNTGYVTNLATVTALVGKGDCVIGDEYNHASIADGCTFSGAEVSTFKHNDMNSLEARLQGAGKRNKLVVVDGVFSMEGDIAPLPEICGLCRRYDALLMVDEAHSLGVLGITGRGVQEHFGLPADAIDIKMGTLSKSLGSCGGFIAAKAAIIDYLRHAARGYILALQRR